MPHLYKVHIDGLVQERRNSIAIALELRLSCTNLSIYSDMKFCWGLSTVSDVVPNCIIDRVTYMYVPAEHFTATRPISIKA